MTPEQWEIVRANMGLVRYTMKRWRVNIVEYDDVYDAGLETLMKCAKKFDPTRGVRFSTYAVRSIGRAIIRARRMRERLPKGVLNINCRAAGDEVGTDAEVADEAGMIADLLDSLPVKEAAALRARFGIGVADGNGRTLQDIGEEMGVSKERVRQVQRVALIKIRTMLRRRL